MREIDREKCDREWERVCVRDRDRGRKMEGWKRDGEESEREGERVGEWGWVRERAKVRQSWHVSPIIFEVPESTSTTVYSQHCYKFLGLYGKWVMQN